MSLRSDSVDPASLPASAPVHSAWIYNPWLDLLVGCGAWSAPLLLIAALLPASHERSWVMVFYLLALAFNYPHFMATVYRAYGSRAEFEKYKIFTLHITLLLAFTAALTHVFYWLLPWIFTLYICWSPWHYTGQNYGLLMMFARRTGAGLSPGERRSIRLAFIVSYVMLLASFETGGSSDSLILSLGLPSKITLPLRLALALAFAVISYFAFRGPIRRIGWDAMIAPLTLLLTQFLWFVLPTLLELRSAYHVPQTRYSSGILAILHSAQYLWITSYYQRRRAREAGESGWHFVKYFLVLVAGGIALFIPGPWLVSRVFRFDFTTSFLIFTAVVNIHHFLLDGAIWKLRDSKIGSLLAGPKADQSLDDNQARPVINGSSKKHPKPSPVAASGPSWFGNRGRWLPVARVGLVAALLLIGGLDQVHFALGTVSANLPSLKRAESMDPYDSMLQARIAFVEARQGRKDESLESLTRAVAINPYNAGLQQQRARALLEMGRYKDAYEHYKRMLSIFPRDADALVNFGLLAARFGHSQEALDAWRTAIQVDRSQPNPYLYFAEALDQQGDMAGAARQWEGFLQAAASLSTLNSVGINGEQMISARIRLGDDDSRLNRSDAALTAYRSAIDSAERAHDPKLESLALAHMADLQESAHDLKAAAASYQRGLSVDEKSSDSHSEAFDWFNYGQFLRRHQISDELAYACFLHAEALLQNTGGADLQTAQGTRKDLEARLGKHAAAIQKNLSASLERARNLQTSFD